MGLVGNTALVTGASSGIGRSIALALARNGAAVAVNYLKNEKGAQETVDAIRGSGSRAVAIQADISDSSAVSRLVDQAADSLGGLAILVNNAGDLIRGSKIVEMSDELWDQVLGLNLKSVFLCCRAAIPKMVTLGQGRIVNVTSVTAYTGGAGKAVHYATAKAGVIALTKGLGKELAATGITVNAVAPAIVTTPYHDRHNTPAGLEAGRKRIPMGRLGEPIDIAHAVVFLASSEASYVTGQTLVVDGGYL